MNRIFSLLILALFCSSCGNNDRTETPANTEAAIAPPANIGYQVVRELPHDTLAFTEGLQYVDGKFYESVGLNGQSDIRITDPETGKKLVSTKLDQQYFGEGVTVLNGKAYQLTYRENTAFVYDPATLKQLASFSYQFGEGWGMTTDGKSLIISTGSSNLYYIDPLTFKEIKRVPVFDQYGPVSDINELEYIKGSVYANQWKQYVILKINPSTGQIIGKADLSDLPAKYGYPTYDKASDGEPEVLNGIAYDSTRNRIFITGKNWPKIFEVKLDN